jgi:4'-phosphopantetheinyl transferase
VANRVTEPMTQQRPDIDVWIAPSDRTPASAESFADVLSASELAESRRFRFEEHRRRFLATRLFRRRVLAHYLGMRPKELAFSYGSKGKPALASALGSDLMFNDAEAEGLAVIAVARGLSVGVDVERLRAVPDAQSIVSSFGSPLERDTFASIGQAERDDSFMRWWTGKEAFVKAAGEGLSLPLASFSILVSAGGRLRLVGAGDGCSLLTFDPAPGYVGALVAWGPRPRLRLRAWGASSAEAPREHGHTDLVTRDNPG